MHIHIKKIRNTQDNYNHQSLEGLHPAFNQHGWETLPDPSLFASRHHRKACFLWVASMSRENQPDPPLFAAHCYRKACFQWATIVRRETQQDKLHASQATTGDPCFL